MFSLVAKDEKPTCLIWHGLLLEKLQGEDHDFFKFSNLSWPAKPEPNLLCTQITQAFFFFFFFLLFISSFSRCGWCDDWDIQGNTHPTYEALRVPERVESWYVVFQDGLTAALTARRKQSEEALLAVLLAVTVMEACWRNGGNSFKCFLQYVKFFDLFFPQSVKHKTNLFV